MDNYSLCVNPSTLQGFSIHRCLCKSFFDQDRVRQKNFIIYYLLLFTNDIVIIPSIQKNSDLFLLPGLLFYTVAHLQKKLMNQYIPFLLFSHSILHHDIVISNIKAEAESNLVCHRCFFLCSSHKTNCCGVIQMLKAAL